MPPDSDVQRTSHWNWGTPWTLEGPASHLVNFFFVFMIQIKKVYDSDRIGDVGGAEVVT